ncbi:MAG TPA: hypothetical protein VG052_00970 [Puia sp.]|nr:hypothetical protein [Puia sp.]
MLYLQQGNFRGQKSLQFLPRLSRQFPFPNTKSAKTVIIVKDSSSRYSIMESVKVIPNTLRARMSLAIFWAVNPILAIEL